MAIQQYIGVFIVLITHQFCFGQQETVSSGFPGLGNFPPPNFAPHVEIRVNNKSMELNAEESEKFMKESMKDSRGVQSITVLNSQDVAENMASVVKMVSSLPSIRMSTSYLGISK